MYVSYSLPSTRGVHAVPEARARALRHGRHHNDDTTTTTNNNNKYNRNVNIIKHIITNNDNDDTNT